MIPLRDHRWFGVAITVYVVLAMLLVLVNHRHQRQRLLEGIDQNLRVVAAAVPHILADDFHDRAVGPEGISREEDLRNQKALTDYAEVTGVAWVWTDVEHGGNYHITACNRTDQSDQAELATDYWVQYNQVSEDEQRAFRSAVPIFSTFTDKWGTFRAVFVPKVSPAGRTYLACAEYELSHVQQELWHNTVRAMVGAGLLLLAVAPLLWLHLRQIRRHHRSLSEANTRLENGRRRLATVLDAIDDAVVAADRDGRIRWANALGRSWLAGSDGRLEGRPVDEVVSLARSRDEAPIVDPWGQLTRTASPLLEGDLVLSTRTSGELTVTAAAARLPEGDPGSSVVLVFRDVSRQRELEASMRQSQKLETVGRLAGGVAHDFNNLLMSILGSAELLRDGIDPGSPAADDLDRILSASNRAAELTRQLLLFSRRRPEVARVVDVHEILDEVSMLLRHGLDRSIAFEVRPGAARSLVLGEPALLSSALVNLGVNARDAMPDGGRLTMATREAGPDTLVLEVCDSGEGMPADVIEHIFEPFFTTKDMGRGTGLGLAVVYSTITGMGGEIAVESEVGRGTTVTVSLPLTSEAPGRTDDRAAPLDRDALEGLQVLVVEDEPELREVAVKALERHGARATVAGDGVEAELKLQADAGVDLVMLDLVMPVRDGLKTLPVIRQKYPELPVLLCSGYDPSQKAGALADSTRVGFLAKPYTRDEMVTAILALLARVRRA